MTYLEPLKDPRFLPAHHAAPTVRTTAGVKDLSFLLSLFKYRALVAVYEEGKRYEVPRSRTRTPVADTHPFLTYEQCFSPRFSLVGTPDL